MNVCTYEMHVSTHPRNSWECWINSNEPGLGVAQDRSPSSSESFDSRPLLKRTLPTAPTLSHCCKQDWSSFTLIASASNGKILTGKLFSVSRTAVLRIRRSLQSLSTHSHLACISTLKGYIAQPLSSHTFMYRARLVNSLKSHWNRLRTLKKCLP